MHQNSKFKIQAHLKRSDTFTSFKTETYKLHFFCTPTKYRFIILTDPNCANQTDLLKEIYTKIFIEYVIKNPLHKPFTKINCQLFSEQLDKFITYQTFFN